MTSQTYCHSPPRAPPQRSPPSSSQQGIEAPTSTTSTTSTTQATILNTVPLDESGPHQTMRKPLGFLTTRPHTSLDPRNSPGAREVLSKYGLGPCS